MNLTLLICSYRLVYRIWYVWKALDTLYCSQFNFWCQIIVNYHIYNLKNMGWFQISLGHFSIVSVPDPYACQIWADSLGLWDRSFRIAYLLLDMIPLHKHLITLVVDLNVCRLPTNVETSHDPWPQRAHSPGRPGATRLGYQEWKVTLSPLYPHTHG